MHSIVLVHVQEGQVRVECSCGWKSGWTPDDDGEIAPRREWAEHAGEAPEDFGPHANSKRRTKV